MMRAILCREHGGPEVMQYEELSQPKPSSGEVLIQAEAIGVNYVDTMRRSGNHPAAPIPPFTPGIELCGRVVGLGEGVTNFQEGDRVIGRCVTHGAYAEYVPVEARFTVRCPETIPAEEAAALFVNGQTAYHALVTMGGVQPGESVLITAAAGGVGTCAVQIAKILGARVIAAAGTSEKLDLLSSLGAEVSVNYSHNDWPEKVLDATHGRGADLILESVGGDIGNSCLSCWAAGGRLVVFGKASGKPLIVRGDELLFGNRTVYGLAVGTVIEDENLMRRAMDQLQEWHSTSQLHLLIGTTYPLSEAAEAHRQLENRQTHGKVVLIPEHT